MRALLFTVSSIALLGMAPSALAQEADATPQTDATDEGGLQDIIVTAQKRPEQAQRAPLALTTIDADDLAAAHINGATDLQRIVPNLSAQAGGGVGDAGGANTLFTIRGLGASATGPQGSAGVAAHFDGVFQQGGLSNSQFYDLERIEVAPGPQGTLYGRSAAAGAINVIPAKPEFGTEGAASVTVGNYDAITTQGMLNFTMGEFVAVRAAFQTQNHDGYYSNGYDDQNAFSGRLQVLIEPSDRLSIRLATDFVQLRGRGAGNIVVGGPSAPASAAILPIINNPDLRQRSVSEYCYVNAVVRNDCFQDIRINRTSALAEISYEFGGATLTLLPAFNRTSRTILNSNVPVPFSNFNQSYDNDQFTFEARLASDGDGPLRWVIGGNYYNNRVDTFIDQFINFAIPAPIALPTPPFPPNTAVNAIAASNAFQDQQSQQKSYAVFGQATYSFTDSIRLTVGGRYNHDTSNGRQTLGNISNLIYVFSGFPPLNGQVLRNLLVSPGNPTGAPVITPVQTGSESFNAFTYRVALDVDVGPRSIVYASIGSGYKPGGLNDGGPASSTSPASPFAPAQFFGPERVTHFEIGSKNRFLDNRLQVNVAAYYDDYSNYQNGQTQVVNPLQFGALGFVVTNAGSARIYGIELDTKWRFTDNDELGIAVNYLNARFEDYSAPAYLGTTGPVPAMDFSGFDLPNAPEFSANISYQHTFDLGGRGSLIASAFSHISQGYWTYFAQSPGTYQDAYTSTTLDLTWVSPGEGVRVSAFVSNVEDDDVLVFGTNIGGISGGGLAPPRTYGARVAVNF